MKNTKLDIFKCCDENLLNSSCHFPNHKSVFLQILHDSCVMKYTPLYFVRSNGVYFAQKRPIKAQIFSVQIKINQILVIFEIENRFLKFCATLIVHIEVSLPPPLFLAKAPLNRQTVQAPSPF